ncbi:MAG: hypothetical protein WC554_00305 [Clostridia bacterium]
MGQIGNVWVDIGGNASGLLSEANKAKAAIESISTAAKSATWNPLQGMVGNTQSLDDYLAGLENAKETADSGTKAYGLLRNAVGAFFTYQTAKRIVNFFKESYNETIQYTEAIQNFSRLTGASVEESSRMVQVTEALGITTSTLSLALQQAVRKGYEPTVANLMKMSDEYRALTDPIEKATYLMERFGTRSATTSQQMAELLNLGSETISQMANDVNSALVLSTTDVFQGYLSKIVKARLTDYYQGIKTTVGLEAGGILYTATTDQKTRVRDLEQLGLQLKEAGYSQEQWNVAMRESANDMGLIIDQYGNIIESAADAQITSTGIAKLLPWMQKQDILRENFLETAWASEEVANSYQYMTEEEIKAQIEHEALLNSLELEIGLSGEISSMQETYATAMKKAGSSTKKQQAAIDDLNESYQSFILNSLQSLGTDPTATMGIAYAFGEIDDKSLAVFSAISRINDEFSVGSDEWINAIENVYSRIGDLDNIQVSDKGFTITIMVNYLVNGMPAYNPSAPIAAIDARVNRYLGENVGGMHGGSFVGLAHGGIVPPGFSNDRMPIWVSSGERVDVTPAGNKNIENEQLAGMINELLFAIRGLPRDIRDAVQMVS